MERSTTGKLLIAAIGLAGLLCGYTLAAYAIRRISTRHDAPPPPQAAARDVPERDERIPTNVTPLNAYGRELRSTGT